MLLMMTEKKILNYYYLFWLMFQKIYKVWNTLPNIGKLLHTLVYYCTVKTTRIKVSSKIYIPVGSFHLKNDEMFFKGTPWQPEFSGWAFNLPRGSPCLKRWNNIPTETDILITHTPPLGFGDLCSTGVRAGCVELLHSVQKRIKPKYHIYGHIHEGTNNVDF